MDGARPRRAVAQQTCTHYRLCSLALANPTLAERAIAQRLYSEYTLPTGAADFVEVPSPTISFTAVLAYEGIFSSHFARCCIIKGTSVASVVTKVYNRL